MIIAIFSDTHSNLEATEEAFNEMKKEGVEEYLFVGDAVGYGANPNEVTERVKELAKICVAGNHDYASVGLIDPEFFNLQAYKAICWTKENLKKENEDFLKNMPLKAKYGEISLVHGSFSSPASWEYVLSLTQALKEFYYFDTQIGVIAHSHVPFAIELRKKDIRQVTSNEFYLEPESRYLLNPGSIGQPRDGNPKSSFIIFDTDKKKITFKRVKYDVERAQKKILEKNLPLWLAERLSYGK